jgi:peptide/nickel transport system substrate-binding protein
MCGTRASIGARLAAPLAALALLAGGCGDDDEATQAATGTGVPGEGGTLVWALERDPADLDPLLTHSTAGEIVTRQIYEPLVEQLAAPFDDASRAPGLAISARPSGDRTIWRLRLRPGIRFQDGTPLNASAVLANAERWSSTAEGQALLPNLFEADAPRPDLVRFFLTVPDPRFDERLGSPRLGIVSPRVLGPADRAELASGVNSGTGAFELRERDRTRLLLARNSDWWGAVRGLGPALDQVEFRIVPDSDERIELLETGDAKVASGLAPFSLRKASDDPLLSTLPGTDGGIALERSVRGIDTAREIPSLQAVWLTTVGSG